MQIMVSQFLISQFNYKEFKDCGHYSYISSMYNAIHTQYKHYIYIYIYSFFRNACSFYLSWWYIACISSHQHSAWIITAYVHVRACCSIILISIIYLLPLCCFPSTISPKHLYEVQQDQRHHPSICYHEQTLAL